MLNSNSMDYLKIGKATELLGRDRRFYRRLEMLPGFLSLATLIGLLIVCAWKPVWAAYFLIAFDVYWLLQVIFLAIYLIAGYSLLNKNRKINWITKLEELKNTGGQNYEKVYQLVVLPTYNEDYSIIKTCLEGLINDGWPLDRMIVVLGLEGRAGEEAILKGQKAMQEFAPKFFKFLVTVHPDGVEGEIKGKGSNQSYATKQVKAQIIDPLHLDYDQILVSVFDIDTIVHPGYFSRLAYAFLTVENPHRASYQPIPIYHNNVWQSPFFARVASSSNTFWQIMQQIRPEKLATYSSHSMTFKALVDIGFWSPSMVSEDSRIFWHCLLYYNGDYRVEPLHFPVYMDTTMDKSFWLTIKSLYKQQRRWAWGSENEPYLIFNTVKKWQTINRPVVLRHILIQIYGFHSWATSALIIAVIGWMPMLLGGDRFNSTVLSGNLPVVTTWLMNLALIGMVLSAIIANLLLPRRPKGMALWKRALLVVEWVFVPVSIIIFGAIPCLDAQIRLMRGKYMGFWVTPKARE